MNVFLCDIKRIGVIGSFKKKSHDAKQKILQAALSQNEPEKDVGEMKEEQKEMREDVKNIERMMMQK